MESEVGSVAEGEAGGLWMVEGELSVNTGDSKRVIMVVKDGVTYHPARFRQSAQGMVG